MTKADAYTEFDAALAAAGHPCSAAEAHGLWSGLLCGDVNTPADRAIAALDDEPAVEAGVAGRLRPLFVATRKALEDDSLRFQPLLPDDETPLPDRAQALAQWCQGFLYGLGLSRRQSWPAQIQEILRDFQAIAQLNPDAEGEEDERAFAELVEYLRVGAQLIFTEGALRYEREAGNES
ncbi:conserved hypothetical protein [Methylomarinovum tepidoasis]|uniref:YecA family protein n=1 Tax=Methylomarinovum tepidoasis TaxID=2840183 RepID=A0AAU9CLM9_9GAMM|nr:UPF0149 family protein [Methylomarinovum sp. IN45]BCX88552.1 conserved hypothetical protein [Methylomarinovum sp. IN45]